MIKGATIDPTPKKKHMPNKAHKTPYYKTKTNKRSYEKTFSRILTPLLI